MQNNNWYNFKFYNGPVQVAEIAEGVSACSDLHHSGAYSIFLGQVREDTIDRKKVEAIDYTSNEVMAIKSFFQIGCDAKTQFDIQSLKIIHSLGEVKKGEICLMVLVACGHRKESFKACEYIVERLKKEVPVWGREIFSDQTHTWKINK